jgi:putative Mn2+ efflux pump MntP
MIYEARRLDLDKKKDDLANVNVLLMLSVATSIDALAVGLSFAFLAVAVVAPAIVIGIVTFLLSFLGICAGSKIGHLFENRIEIVGGLTLIGIGVKILVEHLL